MRIEESRPHDARPRLLDQVRHIIRRKHYNRHRPAPGYILESAPAR
jgi:hypothetical protein